MLSFKVCLQLSESELFSIEERICIFKILRKIKILFIINYYYSIMIRFSCLKTSILISMKIFLFYIQFIVYLNCVKIRSEFIVFNLDKQQPLLESELIKLKCLTIWLSGYQSNRI